MNTALLAESPVLTGISVFILILLTYQLVVRNRRWLDHSAFALAWLLAFVIGYCLPIIYLLFPIVFLVAGSLASRLNNSKNTASSARDARQVLANAGISIVAAIMYFIAHNEVFTELFILNYAVATADTFSTEFGRRYGSRTADILTFKPLDKGLSGGVSAVGTTAGLVGSSFISLLALFLGILTPPTVLWTTFFGFLGMIIDSILGSGFQPKYRIGGTLHEEGRSEQRVRGYAFVTNNAVNFLSIGITYLCYFVFKSIWP